VCKPLRLLRRMPLVSKGGLDTGTAGLTGSNGWGAGAAAGGGGGDVRDVLPAEEALTPTRVRQYSPQQLAYLGDGVWELYLRQAFMFPRTHMNKYQEVVLSHARAEGQAACLDQLNEEGFWTDAEQCVPVPLLSRSLPHVCLQKTPLSSPAGAWGKRAVWGLNAVNPHRMFGGSGVSWQSCLAGHTYTHTLFSPSLSLNTAPWSDAAAPNKLSPRSATSSLRGWPSRNTHPPISHT